MQLNAIAPAPITAEREARRRSAVLNIWGARRRDRCGCVAAVQSIGPSNGSASMPTMTLIHSMSAALLAFHAPITPIVPRNIHATMLLRPDAIWRGAAIGAVGASVVAANVLDRKSLKTSTSARGRARSSLRGARLLRSGRASRIGGAQSRAAEAEKVIQEALAAKEKEAQSSQRSLAR